MAKITITLTDHESGNVRIDCDPIMPKLVQMKRDGALTPAEGYALIALGVVVKTSIKEAQANMKAKMRAAGVFMPQSPRFKVQ